MMRSQFNDAVYAHYISCKESGSLSPNMHHPTPASLRNECLRLLDNSCNVEDLKTLTCFLGVSESHPVSEPMIKKMDLDKLKPLVNFLHQKTSRTADRNIEMLAWLTKFPLRPYKQFRSQYFKENGEFDAYKIYSIQPTKTIFSPSNPEETSEIRYRDLIADNKAACFQLEYPSGVRLSVNTTDLSLIAQLVRL